MIFANIKIMYLFFPATWSFLQTFPVEVMAIHSLTVKPILNNSRVQIWISRQTNPEAPGGRRTSAGPRTSRSLRAQVTGRSRSASCRDSWTSAPACVRLFFRFTHHTHAIHRSSSPTELNYSGLFLTYREWVFLKYKCCFIWTPLLLQ